MNARLITTQEQATSVTAFCTITEAAKTLNCTETTIRRCAKKLGVRKIKGQTAAGFILIASHPVDVAIAYHE